LGFSPENSEPAKFEPAYNMVRDSIFMPYKTSSQFGTTETTF
jgi:hypothetical protein